MNFIDLVREMIDDMMTDRDRRYFGVSASHEESPPTEKDILRLRRISRNGGEDTNALVIIDVKKSRKGRKIRVLCDKDTNKRDSLDFRTWTYYGTMWTREFDIQDPDVIPYIRKKVAKILGIY
jgi:hypothetical protein